MVDRYQQLVYSQGMFTLSNKPQSGKEFGAESAKP